MRELSERLNKELGDELFTKLYRLCMEQLEGERKSDICRDENDGVESVVTATNNEYLLEILKELQAHRKAEALVDVTQVVFSLKLLCAYAQTKTF